jgi:hypothetical protein
VCCVVITLKILPHAYKHFIETLNITNRNFDMKFDEYSMHSYNKTDGGNSSVVVVRQRVKNMPLQPWLREKENEQ